MMSNKYVEKRVPTNYSISVNLAAGKVLMRDRYVVTIKDQCLNFTLSVNIQKFFIIKTMCECK